MTLTTAQQNLIERINKDRSYYASRRWKYAGYTLRGGADVSCGMGLVRRGLAALVGDYTIQLISVQS